MKRFASLMLSAMLALSMFGKDLPLKVAGIQVTTENCTDLMSELRKIPLTKLSGSIAYYPGDRLELEDFVIDGTGKNVAGLEISESMDVQLKGKNAISEFKNGIHVGENVQAVFYGTGSLDLTCKSRFDAPLLMEDLTEVFFNYTQLNVKAKASAIVAAKGEAAQVTRLNFTNSVVNIEYAHEDSKHGYGIENINSLNILHSDVLIKPAEDKDLYDALKVSAIDLKLAKLDIPNADQYTFSATDKTYKNGALPLRTVKWTKYYDPDGPYHVAIGGRLNEGNDFTWKDGVQSGKVRYLHLPDLDCDTLYLDTANISPLRGFAAITLYKSNVVVRVKGKSEFFSYGPGIYCEDMSLHLIGDGYLEARSASEAIYANSLWVQDGTKLKAVGNHGFYNPEETSSKGIIMVDGSADVEMLGSGDNPAIFLNNKYQTDGLELRLMNTIAYPYDESEVFTSNHVRFAKPEWLVAGLTLFGKEVNSFNATHLHEAIHAKKADEKGVDCSIIYDREDNILTCINAEITNADPDAKPFLHVINDLTLAFTWGNRIIINGENPTNFIETEADSLVVRGIYETPVLEVTWGDKAIGNFAQMGNNTKLTFLTLTAKATAKKGIVGHSAISSAALHFQEADIALTAKDNVFENISAMTFKDARIAAPSGATFSEKLMTVVDASLQPVKNGTVWIESYIEPSGEGEGGEEDQALDQVQGDKVQCTKVIKNGQLYLMYKGTMYNVQGAEVK